MNAKTIDMHVHSNYSDGTFSPGELVDLAFKAGLSAFALTDHDTILGIDEAIAAGKDRGIEVIPGIEFSTDFEGSDIHMLGYAFDYRDPRFFKELTALQDTRDTRNRKMIQKMQAHGIDISYEKMKAEDPDGVWTRANFARYLMDHGYVKSVQEAFLRYIGDDGPCYVARERMYCADAITLIHRFGGYAVLAHPHQYKFSEEKLDAFVAMLKSHGLDGIEALYSTHRWTDESRVKQLARKYSLCITGGSDFHGSNKPHISLGSGMGNLKIPYGLWQDLREHKAYK